MTSILRAKHASRTGIALRRLGVLTLGYGQEVATVQLRAIRADDLVALSVRPREDDPFGFFGHRAVNGLERRFAADGLISDDAGQLAVQTQDRTMLGSVDWFAVRHGPSSTARALNIGVFLLPEHHGRGYGAAAHAVFADYLFANTLVERLEAGTDVDNIAEQRALERAGFHREGVARHAQFRAGAWHDLVTYSRLRADPVA